MNIIKTYPKYLSKHIKFFYTVQASALENINKIHWRLPDGTLDLVFNLGAPVLLSRDGIHYATMPSVALTGLHTNRSFLQYTGNVNLVGAVFQPGSAHLFMNDTLEHYKEFTDCASLVFGNGIFSLANKMYDKPSEEGKHQLLESYLLAYINKYKVHDSAQITEAILQIHAQNGNIRIAQICKNNFITERTLRRGFNEKVGMSPKVYAQIVRIKNFSKRYELSRISLADTCFELGYTDQSHINKDFQKIVGTSPTFFFKQLDKMGEEFIHLI